MNLRSQSIAFEHKCRRCGDVIHGPTTLESNGYAQLTSMAVNGKPMRQAGATFLSLVDMHSCADGGQGLTDLIGYRIVTD